jgi:hypothetical protein
MKGRDFMYSCYICNAKVGQQHFTAHDGRILCEKCSEGVKPCTDRQKLLCEVLEDGFYYFYKFDLFIKLAIKKSVSEDGAIKIKFEDSDSELIIWTETIVKKVSRPGNIIAKFDWCYFIKNTEGEVLGYIGKPSINI